VLPVVEPRASPEEFTVTLTVPTGATGDVAVIDVAELTVKLAAAMAPKKTAVAPMTLVPVMGTTACPPSAAWRS